MRAFALGLLLALPAAGDTAVTVHGLVIKGDARVEGDEVVLAQKGKERRYARDELLLAERDDGRLVYAPDLEARLRGYEYLVREARVEECLKVLGIALGARDARLARRLLDLAETDGLIGKRGEEWKRRVEELERRLASPDPAKAKAAEAGFERVASLHASLLVARARANGADGLALLREALRLRPLHPEALELLAERAPKDFPLGDASFWLDWHLDLETRGARPFSGIADLKASWRGDLFAAEAGRVRVVTPVRDTRTVARCLAYGQLACAALEDLFGKAESGPRAARSLVVLLYADRKEYLAKSTDSQEVRDFLAATNGHYSPSEHVSRVAWDREPGAERRVARVFVHELTHHWVMEQNPRYSDAELHRPGEIPGYWIVEGLATFFEEGRFDPDLSTWSLFDARAPSLDTVAALSSSRDLLPWDLVYSCDAARFQQLPRDPGSGKDVVRRWQVGSRRVIPARLFYEQAAATVHFLYHGEGGAYRARLVDYVTSHYTGKAKDLTIEAAFGLSPLKLGRKVEVYAAEVAGGWRPEGS